MVVQFTRVKQAFTRIKDEDKENLKKKSSQFCKTKFSKPFGKETKA